jgi:hypothetical protein
MYKIFCCTIRHLTISKHVSPIEVASTCLQIPIVQKSITMKYVDSKWPRLLTRLLSKSKFH